MLSLRAFNDSTPAPFLADIIMSLLVPTCQNKTIFKKQSVHFSALEMMRLRAEELGRPASY